MSIETAQLVLYSITTAGVVLWLSALLFFMWATKADKQPVADRFDFSEAERQPGVSGSVEIEGRPEELAARAVSVLVKETAAPITPLKILDKTDDRISFEGVSRPSTRGGMGQCVRRGELRFRPVGHDRTQVEFDVELAGGKVLLVLGVIFVILGLIGLAVLFWVLRTCVVPSEKPSVRGQVFQMFQACQLLWEPFLFGGLYRFRYRVVRLAFDALIHNLPYHDD